MLLYSIIVLVLLGKGGDALESSYGWLISVISLFSSLLAVTYAYGKKAKRIEIAISKFEKINLEKMNAAMDRVEKLDDELYNRRTKLPIYITRTECVDRQIVCKDAICRKVDLVKAAADDISQRNDDSFKAILSMIESNRSTINAHYASIQNFVGRVETKFESVETRFASFEMVLKDLKGYISKVEIKVNGSK